MKVFLVQSYQGQSEAPGPIFPLGLSYIASALSHAGHDIEVLDMNLHPEHYGELRRALEKARPDVVGVSLRNIDTTDRFQFVYCYSFLPAILRTIRCVCPHQPLMIGGTGFSLFARTIMERHPELDFGVYLEGEEATPELLANLHQPERVKGIYYRRDGQVLFSGDRTPPDFERSQPPRRDYFPLQLYDKPLLMGIQGKRGCLSRCAYCCYPDLNGFVLRMRPPEEIVGEIQDLQRRHGIREVIFADSVFNQPYHHAKAICHEIIQRDMRVRWSAWFTLKGFTEQFVTLAEQAGCYRMCLSPDGASKVTLKSLHKEISESDIERAIKIAKRHPAIDFRFSIICSPPQQGFLDLLKSLRFYVRTQLLIPNSRCLVSWIRVLPKTAIHAQCIKRGLFSRESDLLPVQFEEVESLFIAESRTEYLATILFKSLIKLSRRLSKREKCQRSPKRGQ